MLHLCTRASRARRQGALGLKGCGFRVSSLGGLATGSPCPADGVSFYDGQSLVDFRGCAPAWQPDGILTFVRGGTVFGVFDDGCPKGLLLCERPLFSTGRLLDQLGRQGAPYRIRELAWLGPERLVLLVQGRTRLDQIVAVFAGRRVIGRPRPFLPGLSHLRPSPRGGFLATLGQTASRTFVRFDASGRFEGFGSSLPEFLLDGRALAESPDGRWLASALRGTIQISEPACGSRSIRSSCRSGPSISRGSADAYPLVPWPGGTCLGVHASGSGLAIAHSPPLSDCKT